MQGENNYKILIVDDMPSNLQLLGNLLRQENYIISFASQGVDAIERVTNNAFDLILLDIMMPEMDGFEVCKAIKSIPEKQEIPIIFITAKNDSESIVKGFDLGASDYVTKPFNYKELLVRIKTQLDLRGKKRIIESMNQLLEKRVMERTKKLKDANNRILKLDNAKNDFITIISHELRTPLNSLNGFSELIENSTKEPKTLEHIRHLKTAVNQLTKLVNLSTLITSLKADKYKMNLNQVSFNELLMQLENKIQKSIKKKSLVLKSYYLPNDVKISIDHKLMLICLENILENAIQYSPEHSTITIKACNNQIHGQIIIEDEGPGFPVTRQKELFEMFNSSDTMHHSKGFGLGLFISKLIMDAHLGKIEIKNKQNGAQVLVKFPL